MYSVYYVCEAGMVQGVPPLSLYPIIFSVMSDFSLLFVYPRLGTGY